jgi:PAS domain S-box-containing protein
LAVSNNKSAIHVLHVDDDPSLQEITKLMLLDLDNSFKIDCACCVDEALKKLAVGNYDVVVSDYEMPQKDGLQFLKELREQKNDIPFILFTGKGREEVAIQALNLGADAYHNKQGNPETVYGELAHSIKFVVDHKKTKQELVQSELKFRTLADSSVNWLYWLEKDGSLVYVSPSCEKITGYKPEELIKNPSLLMQIIDSEDKEVTTPHFETIPTEGLYEHDFQIKTKDGERKWISHICNPVFDEKGKLHGRRVVNIDITERKKNEEALILAIKRFEFAQHAANAGVWDWDVKTSEIKWTKKMFELFGFDPKKTAASFAAWESVLYPQDKEKAKANIMKALKEHSFLDNEYRIVLPNSEIRWINSFGEGEYDAQGNPLTMSGICIDITQRKKEQELLKESLAAYSNLINGMTDSAWVIDFEGNFLEVNNAAVELLGYSKEELLSIGVAGIDKHLNREQVGELIEKLPKVGKQFFETVHTRKDGTEIPVEISSSMITYHGKQVILSIARNITERIKFENQLAVSESTYRSIVELIPDGIATTNLRGTITSVNKAFLDLTGFSKEEIVGKNFTRLPTLRKRDLPKYAKIFADILRGKISSSFEFMYSRKDKSVHVAEARFSIIKQNNKIEGLQVHLRDLTENRKNETKYQDLANTLPEVVFETDIDGKLLYANKVGFEIFGYSQEDFDNGLCILDLVHKKDHQKAKENFRKALTNVFSIDNEYTCVRKDGGSFPSMIVSKPIIEVDKSIGLRGLVIDLTQSKKAEVALAESEKKSKAIVEFSPIGIATVGTDKYFLTANQVFCKILGYTQEELQKLMFKDVTYPADLQESFIKMGELEKNIISSFSLEKRYLKKDGAIIEGRVTVSALRNQNETPNMFIAELEDVTEHKKAEVNLQKNKALLLETEKTGRIGGWEFDVNTLTQNWTDETFHILEIDISQGEPKVPQGLEFINPPYRAMAEQAIQRAIEHGESYNQEWEITTIKGNKRWVHAVAKANWENGKIKSISGSFQDITDCKKVEEQLKESHKQLVVLNEKLHVNGSLIRHDVGNKLMLIRSNLYLLKKQIGDNPKITKYLEGIDSAINVSGELFEFSRLYEKIGVEKPSSMDVFECFNVAAAMFSNLRTVKIVNECQGLRVVADSLLRQFFYNLIDNSLKHGEKVTQIHLHCTKDGDELKLFYEDNGVGVPGANKSKLFTARFTSGQGSGLGLYLIKKMMDVYGWKIQEVGEPGKGAKFVLTIPRISQNGKENFHIT